VLCESSVEANRCDFVSRAVAGNNTNVHNHKIHTKLMSRTTEKNCSNQVLLTDLGCANAQVFNKTERH